jgi:hypothetical protein
LTPESACTVGENQRNAKKKEKRDLRVIILAPFRSSGSLPR